MLDLAAAEGPYKRDAGRGTVGGGCVSTVAEGGALCGRKQERERLVSGCYVAGFKNGEGSPGQEIQGASRIRRVRGNRSHPTASRGRNRGIGSVGPFPDSFQD